jgi:GTP cyclohydrolase II
MCFLLLQSCDCKEQLNMAMEYVQRHGGAVIYLQQEGRGIGLANKVAAYELQDHGLDTVDANLQLGFPDDARQYGVLPSILQDMGIRSIRLMTNNPRKIQRLTALGITIVDTIPILALANSHNRKYLETKQERMSHTNFGHILANDQLPAHGITNNNNMDHSNRRQYTRNFNMESRRSATSSSSPPNN